ncbi:MAG: hypothetical protein IPK85_22405 [Gemmatimonadetes bacterium]|nr:hypothetical protein [Gemmatimonadota bacterium]
MTDFSADRQKDLDLVISIPRTEAASTTGPSFFSSLVGAYGIVLSREEMAILATLPEFNRAPVGDVLLAVEAKAVMTAHVRAGPRLHDELTAAWQCINGGAPQAIAAALGMINASSEFVSPKMNKARSPGKHWSSDGEATERC